METHPTTPKSIPAPSRKMPFASSRRDGLNTSSSMSSSPISPRRVMMLRRTSSPTRATYSSSTSPTSRFMAPALSPPSTPDQRRRYMRMKSRSDVITSPQEIEFNSYTIRVWKEKILPEMRISQTCIDMIEFERSVLPYAVSLLKHFAKTYSPVVLASSPVCAVLNSRVDIHKPIHSNCSECHGCIETMCSFCIDTEEVMFRRIARRLHTVRKIWFYDLEKWVRSLKEKKEETPFQLDKRRVQSFEKRAKLIHSMNASTSMIVSPTKS